MSQLIRLRNGRFGRVAILSLDQFLVEHAHADSHIQYWLNGAQNPVSVDGVSTPFNRHRAVAINSWQPHASPRFAPGEHTTFLLLYLRNDWLKDICDQVGSPSHFTSASFEFSPEIQHATAALCRHMLDCIGPDGEEIESLLRVLVHQSVLKIYSGPETVLASTKLDRLDPRIGRAIRLMNGNLDARICLEELASISGLSRPHFFALFRKDMKVSPNVYWNTLRMETAIQQLVSTGIAMGDIAEQLGFSEPANFSRFFKQHAGVCPSRYRTAAVSHGLTS